MQNDLKLIIGIATCEKHSERQDAVRNTWGKDPKDIAVLFLIGREGQKSELNGDTLYLNCSDTYADLWEKTIAFLQYCERNFDYDYIYKCDDDTYVNISEIRNVPYNEHDYCGGPIHEYDEKLVKRSYELHSLPFTKEMDETIKYTGSWVNGGGGYFLSRKAVRVILSQHKNCLKVKLPEDVAVSYILKMNRIALSSLRGVGLARHDFCNKFWVNSKTPFISAHPITPQDMVLIHNRRNPAVVLGRYLLPKIVNKIRREIGWPSGSPVDLKGG